MSNRKVVSELTKLWEAVASKGRLRKEGGLNDLRNWVSDNPTISSFQSTLNDRFTAFQREIRSRQQLTPENVAETTREKVGKFMSAYEEFIGISEVRSAHARVLSTEAKFIDCQEHRRLASKELSEIHNKLMEIRTELDRTQRGDESYLDLIKEEFTLMKQERIIRKHFEELERTEREVFSELSSALRFSHEKERAQNEKTKYWSIVGSVIGAGLGVLGTTINNRMKQSHVKIILEETSAQVRAIQSTVENLSQKISQTAVLTSSSPSAPPSPTQVSKAEEEQEKLTKSLEKSVNILHQLIISSQVAGKSGELSGNVNQFSGDGNVSQIDMKKYLENNQWQLSALAASCAVSYLLYKFM